MKYYNHKVSIQKPKISLQSEYVQIYIIISYDIINEMIIYLITIYHVDYEVIFSLIRKGGELFRMVASWRIRFD